MLWGGLLVLAGIVLLLSNMGLLPFSIGDIFRYGWPLVLIVVGVLVLLGARGTRTGDASPDNTIRFSGKTVRDEKLSFNFGEYDIDLSGAEFPEGPALVKVSNGIGDLKIRVPRGLPLSIRLSAGIGDLKLFENKDEGFSPRLDFTSPDYDTATRRLQLHADVGLGDIDTQYGTNQGG